MPFVPKVPEESLKTQQTGLGGSNKNKQLGQSLLFAVFSYVAFRQPAAAIFLF